MLFKAARILCIQSAWILLFIAQSMHAAEPVRMGSGFMTFDTVPDWGLDSQGKSQIGSTHGNVVVDSQGQIYTSSSRGIFVFSSDGKVLRQYLGSDHTGLHDMEIRNEDGLDYIYGARNKAGEGIKFEAVTGEVKMRFGIPTKEECGLEIAKWSPTAITVAPDGDVYLSDGYASNRIFRFNKDGEYQSHFGRKGNGTKEFNTAHGMTLDNRYSPPRLLICDRNHQPKGRLVHYSLDGNYIEEVMPGLGMPTSVAIRGDYVAVPDLQGRLVILDKDNTIISVLGFNSDTKTRGSFKVPQEQWQEGIFSGTHGACWDDEGNLYVQDWNVSGRIMKLVRVSVGQGEQ
ncbi:MAG: hypothetical protein KAT44_08105 [Pirellulales bacterium]|nr:hypothetical protein [Pirellulales bacterium]